MTTQIHEVAVEVNESLVCMLEDLLVRAKSGELHSMAGVCMTSIGGEFGEFYSDSSMEDAISYLAYLRVLQMRFEREIPFD